MSNLTSIQERQSQDTRDGATDYTGLLRLGTMYDDNFQRLGKLEDLENAIKYMSRTLDLAPADNPDLPEWLTNLGVLHTDRFELLGEPDDLEKAIECDTRALAMTPADHPKLPRRLVNLGVSHADRFWRLGELHDIEKAIECDSRALSLTPDDHPDLPDRLAHLGASHDDRFRRLGELRDIEKAIEYESRALTLTPDDHPDLTHRLANLGASHGNRFKRLGEPHDLEMAIEYDSRALALTPDGHPDLPHQLANLGASHTSRYQRQGELRDLEKAIECDSRALALTPSGHPELLGRLGNLGASHNYRFERLGELHDLDRAIECNSRALGLTPNGHPELPDLLTNLGASHTGRFRRLGEINDLERVIEYDSRALALTPEDHPHLSYRLANLGASHAARFKRLSELQDLERAIEYDSRALALTPDDHPDLGHRLTNLGMSHTDRFQRLSEPHDLKKATGYYHRALALIPIGHPFLPDVHFNLAKLYLFQYQHTADSCYLLECLNSFRKATQSSTGAPRDKFRYSLHWATLALEHSSLNRIEAHQTAIDLLPQFIWLGATTNQRYEDLRMAGNFPVQAASAAILSSKYDLAVEWVEHARCVVWNQSLMLRTPLDELQSSHPTLANRLEAAALQLHHASLQPRAPQTLSYESIIPERAATQHSLLAMEYNELLLEARKIPGFEDFLRPMKSSDLVRASRHGPIVVIVCHNDRSDALITLPRQDKVHSVPLLKFSRRDAQHARSEIQRSLRNQGIRERGAELDDELEEEDCFRIVLKLLWDGIVKPVLDFLGYMGDVPKCGSDLPHITWCPTGVVSFLPLHAAGDYDRPYSRIFDYVISSYTPTLAALLLSTPSTLGHDLRVLGVGQEVTSLPGYRLSKLPGTTKELGCIKEHTNKVDQFGYSELMGDKATTTAVLDAMEKHDWVHLACHAHQNVGDATKSGFFLHDGILDLASINRRSFRGKGLAFLSACQTATGDDKLPDEAIHLASGMLMAGYTSVIATMWSVVDDDAPFVADKIYGQLLKDGKLGNGEAGKALHNAVAELRGKVGEGEFGRWVPYIHIGS